MPVVRARITSKGQVTIPAAVRRQLRVGSGDEVVFEFDSGERASVSPLRRRPASALSGAFAKAVGPAQLRGQRRKAWRRRAKALVPGAK